VRAAAAAVLAAAAILELSGCALHRVPAPPPNQPAGVSAMTAVAERVRRRPPERGYALAVAPVTLNFEEDRYRLDLRPEFAAAVADLATKRGRLDPVGPAPLAGIPVRNSGVFDPYDVAQYLLLRFSPVGFSADSARAALVLVTDCGPGCGSLLGVGLRRAANRSWRVAQVLRLPTPAATEP
jgi:hypothetical protein